MCPVVVLYNQKEERKKKKKKKEVNKMYKICYNVENYWGIEVEELDERFQNYEECERFGNEEFDKDEEWWIEEV